MEYNSIGKNIKIYRMKKNLKQEELAELMDLSVNYISMLERGDKLPSIETLIKLVNILDVSADVLLSGVTKSGYKVKESMLQDRLDNLSSKERDKILEILDVLIKYAE